jgi:UPF0716 family protein affecting phage T7 exclusion
MIVLCLLPCFFNTLNGLLLFSPHFPVNRAVPTQWFMSQICAYPQTFKRENNKKRIKKGKGEKKTKG